MLTPVRTAALAALEGRPLSCKEAEDCIALLPEHLPGVMAAAAGVSYTAPLFTCGIINAKSGTCSEDCAFCSQSRYHKTNTPVYALMDEEKLLAHAHSLGAAKITRMGIVTSGAAPSGHEVEHICRAAERIRENVDIRLCASLGLLEADQARMLKDAGISSYHHNLECARSFYPHICTTHSYEARVNTVRHVKAAGLRICSGGIFGVGESWAQRLELSATLQELHVDSIPINFLIAIPGTRLEGTRVLTLPEALALTALLRLMHPARDIILCGGRNTIYKEWDRLAIFAGANGVMVGDYLTTAGASFARDMHMLRECKEVGHA